MDINDLNRRQMHRLMNSELLKECQEDSVLEFLQDDRVALLSYEKGNEIYSRLNFKRSLGYILEGEAVVYADNGGNRDLPMRRLSKGSFFGIAALFNDEDVYVSRIIASNDAKVILIDQDAVEEFVKSDSCFAMNLIKFLSNRVRFLNQRISLLSSNSSLLSTAEYLMANAKRKGNSFRLDVSYTVIAKALNISRSSLYRSLDELESKEIISRDGKEIFIRDMSLLNKMIL